MKRPQLRLPPPIWRESRMGLEMASLLRDPVFRGEGIEDAAGQPVLLIPGFLAGDDSLGLMTKWLRRTGHRTRRAGMRMNVGCSEAAVGRIEERLEEMVERHERRVAIVGQSRGGLHAKVLAHRRPDLVSGIVTLGSPLLDPFAVHPLVRLQLIAVGALGTIGAPGLFGRDCRAGACCKGYWRDLRRPLRRDVGFLSLYSESDGIVDWRACLHPDAEHVEVGSSHLGMGVNPATYRAVASGLAAMRERAVRPALPGHARAA